MGIYSGFNHAFDEMDRRWRLKVIRGGDIVRSGKRVFEFVAVIIYSAQHRSKFAFLLGKSLMEPLLDAINDNKQIYKGRKQQ